MKTEFCCDIFPSFIPKFHWFYDRSCKLHVMPHFDYNGIKYRINYCPSCGKEVRGIEIPDEQFTELYL